MKIMTAPNSLKNSLTLNFVLVASLPLLITVTIILHTMNNILERDIMGKNKLLAESLASETSKFLSEPLSILTQIEDAIENSAVIAPSEINTYLDSIIKHYPHFDTIYRLDSHGNILHLAPFSTNYLGVDMSRHPFFQKTLALKKSYWSSTFISLQSGDPTITISLPSKSGMIVGYLNLTSLSAMVQKFNTGKTGYASISDRNGTTIAHPNPDFIYQRIISKDYKSLWANSDKTEGSKKYTADGAKKIGSVAIVPDTSWIVTISQTAKEAFQPLQRIKKIGWTGVAASVSLAILIALFNLKNILSHLSKLTEYTNEVALGNYHFPAVGLNTFREINTVDDNFRSMIDAIKDREEALTKSEERFRQLAENIQDVFWVVSPNWEQLLYISPAYEKIWGRSSENLYKNPLSWLDYIVDTDKPKVQTFITNNSDDSFKAGPLPEFRIFKPDGTVRWINARGFPVLDNKGKSLCIVGISEDYTIRKEADTALRESESRYRLLVETMNDGLFVQNKNGIVTYVNDRLCELLGWTHDEIIGHHFLDFLDTENQQLLTERMNAQPQTEDYGYEIAWKSKHGSNIQTFMSPSDIYDSKGEISGFFAVITDISHMKKTEEMLRQSLKMEAMGTLAGGIAHDFNNILSAVIGYSELAKSKLNNESTAENHINEVLKACSRAKELVKHILTFSRKTTLERQPLQISIIIKEAVKFFRASVPTTISIKQNITTDCGLILAEPTQINQILLNLCTNAVQAMNENGNLEITLTNEDIKNADEKSEVPPGHYVKLSVSDTGGGIPPEITDKIFDPYFTTKKEGRGIGMGLSVVHGIVKNHDGTIVLDNTPGKGATFHLYFPQTETDITPLAAKKKTLPKGNEHILVVEDDKALATMIKHMLNNWGYKVTVNTESKKALELFKNNPDTFDLLFTDQTMPGLTGRELSEEVLKLKPDFPIILCTGHSTKVNAKKAAEMGIKGFVMKPIDRYDLAQLLRKILDKDRR